MSRDDPGTPANGNGPPGNEITRLLSELGAGGPEVANRLAQLVYDELHVIAVASMRREVEGHTWQPTELVHEAFAKLVANEQSAWQNRRHFFCVASRAMRQLLVDHARARRQLKRDGGERVPLTANIGQVATPDVDILDLNDALDRLALLDARQVEVVELRYFAGLTVEETAEALNVSPATVKRDWTVARAYLRRALSDPSTKG